MIFGWLGITMTPIDEETEEPSAIDEEPETAA